MSDLGREITLKEAIDHLPASHMARIEHQELLDCQQLLEALLACGVDNWDGYDYAIDILEDRDE
jgi:hypothetical protein